MPRSSSIYFRTHFEVVVSGRWLSIHALQGARMAWSKPLIKKQSGRSRKGQGRPRSPHPSSLLLASSPKERERGELGSHQGHRGRLLTLDSWISGSVFWIPSAKTGEREQGRFATASGSCSSIWLTAERWTSGQIDSERLLCSYILSGLRERVRRWKRGKELNWSTTFLHSHTTKPEKVLLPVSPWSNIWQPSERRPPARLVMPKRTSVCPGRCSLLLCLL